MISEDGLVVTNAHVVASSIGGEEPVMITLTDGRRFPAKVREGGREGWGNGGWVGGGDECACGCLEYRRGGICHDYTDGWKAVSSEGKGGREEGGREDGCVACRCQSNNIKPSSLPPSPPSLQVHSIDARTDVALLQVETKGQKLPVARIGQSSSLRPGEWVVALGSPQGLANTVTVGIVSAVARLGSELGLLHTRAEYIQTDAAINAGNSGACLLHSCLYLFIYIFIY